MEAPGKPGLTPTWTDSRKQLVGCSLGASRLWFTVAGGIVTEVYHPRIDIPQVRDLGFIVADGRGFWVEVKRLPAPDLSLARPGVPALQVMHRHPRFALTLRVVPDADRDVLLLEVTLEGDGDLRPYVLLAPHLGGTGLGNRAAAGRHRGRNVLWAEQGPFGLALAAVAAGQSDGCGPGSAGYVGVSDGWQDFRRNGRMAWHYRCAGPGNVALLAPLERRSTVALGIATSREAAATLAFSALARPFATAWQRQVRDWSQRLAAHGGVPAAGDPALPEALENCLAASALVLRCHQDRIYPGAMVASLSIPWGESRDDRGGYHLVWPRDLVECAGALLALGAAGEARDVLCYLIASQYADGHWSQNQWLGGKPYWDGVQLDEAAFPVLLAAALEEQDARDGIEVATMVRRALGFIIRHGPASEQDRWEEDSGVSPFTLAVCIAALVAGAGFLDQEERDTALAVADFWNTRLESWTAVQGTGLARRYDVAGYYVRVAPAEVVQERGALDRRLPIRNRAHDPGLPASEQVGLEFLQLVRFGLRLPGEPLVRDSVRIADALLRADTPRGPAWHRYNGDGYGEHPDGRPFDGAGRGRAWPLLTGERGHYALAAGEDPLPYLLAMAAMAGPLGLLPEQVWDAAPPADAEHPAGRPTGAAMPLAWAHAELVKLQASRRLGRPFDRPAPVWRRYGGRPPAPTLAVWTPWAPIRTLWRGERLCVCLPEAGVVHWGRNGWREVRDVATVPAGFGLHRALLTDAGLGSGETVELTWRGELTGWSGQEVVIGVREPGQ